MNLIILKYCIILFGILKISHITNCAPINIQQFVKNVLQKYGYYIPNEEESTPIEEDLKIALENFQRTFGLKETGVLDSETLKLLQAPRCSAIDIKPNNKFVIRRKWKKSSLTYILSNSPSNMINHNAADVGNIIETSINDWTSVCSLNISATRDNSKANIHIGFYRGYHGDVEDFDGPWGILAHAFLPENGNLHFDDDETWSDAIDAGFNLRQTATHELGHILGLDHSFVQSAVMYPYYSSYNPNFDLDKDDIEGIQKLYGKNSFVNTDVTYQTDSTTLIKTTELNLSSIISSTTSFTQTTVLSDNFNITKLPNSTLALYSISTASPYINESITKVSGDLLFTVTEARFSSNNISSETIIPSKPNSSTEKSLEDSNSTFTS